MLQQPAQQKPTTDYSQCVLARLHILWHIIILYSPFLPSPFSSLLISSPSSTFTCSLPPSSRSLFRCFSCPPWNPKRKEQSPVIHVLSIHLQRLYCCVRVSVLCEWGWRCIVCVPVVCVPLRVQQEIQKLGHIDHPGVWKLRGYQSNMV